MRPLGDDEALEPRERRREGLERAGSNQSVLVAHVGRQAQRSWTRSWTRPWLLLTPLLAHRLALQGLSRNAWLVILSSALLGLSDSLTTGNICAAYLFRLAGTNEKVGYAEAVFGLAQLVTALPVGYLSDKVRGARGRSSWQTGAQLLTALLRLEIR